MNSLFGESAPNLDPSSLRLSLRIPAQARYARTARAALATFASFHRVAALDVESMTFALGEALANAIEHAGTADKIEVAFVVDDGAIIATVSDRGRGFAGAPRGLVPLPREYAEDGRGFAIMQRCTDFFDVRSAPGEGTVVTLGRRCRSDQGSASPT